MSTTATQRATDAVRSMIVRRSLAPGQQVRQDGLAEELGLSRSPLREALRALESEGLVRYAPNRGYVVTRLSDRELRQIYLMRMLLEPAVLRSIAAPAPGVLEQLALINDEVRDAGPGAELLSANRRFHFAIFALSDLDVVVEQLERLWNRAAPYQAAYVAQPLVRGRIVAEHAAMLEALKRDDLTALIEIADGHRAVAEATVLATLQV